MQESEYLEVLIQSLKKKLAVLKKIRQKNEQQRVMLLDENLDPEDFDKNVEEKADLVQQLELLDQGFDEVYERVRMTLQQNPKAYQDQVETLQKLIREITADSNQIQADEQRNYRLAQQKFEKVKKQVREVKTSYKAVNNYYRNMMKMNYVDAQFLDNKQ